MYSNANHIHSARDRRLLFANREISLAETLIDINPDTVILFVSELSRNNIDGLVTRLRDKGAIDWSDYIAHARYTLLTISNEEAEDISLNI